MTGYCVEMLDAPYSRYQSCNGGAMRDGGTDPICECQNGGNREQAAESKAAMALHCGKDGGSCTCTMDSERLSNEFIGRMDYVVTTSDKNAQPFVAGYWYSTPRKLWFRPMMAASQSFLTGHITLSHSQMGMWVVSHGNLPDGVHRWG